MKDWTIIQIAEDIGLTRQAVHKYCKQGFLPHRIEYEGNKARCLIDGEEYYNWKRMHFTGIAKGKISKNSSKKKDLTKLEIRSQWLPQWLEWLESGKLGGKPVGIRTREIYEYYLNYFLDLLPKRPSPPIISIANYREILNKIPIENFATRRHIYDALMSISKYLVEINQFNKNDREKLKTLRPKRFLPVKRPFISEAQYKQLLVHSQISGGNSNYDQLVNHTLLVFIANTGLRASEVAKLKLNDINLQEGIVYVWLAKGNKDRKVGLTKQCQEVLLKYLKIRLELNVDSSNFFLNSEANPFNRKTISQKLNRLSHPLGFNLTAHQLRRYFVTSNVKREVSLMKLKIACGHADITTTQGYCMTSQDEVVEAMRGW